MKNKGFSLIEVLVFITILSLFFIAAMTVAVFSLRSIKTQEHKIIATHLAEEAIEWLNSEKEADWNNFISYDTSGAGGSGTTYCLNSLNWASKFSCSGYTLGNPTIFKRELTIKNSVSPTTQVNTTINVSWLEVNGEQKVTIKKIHRLTE